MTDYAAALQSANVKAFLAVIRTGEGTADEDGYRRFFGGKMFDSYADHPRRTFTAGGYTSTAAGAYQALSGTWDDFLKACGPHDFSPASQDIFAVWCINRRGALDDVLSGRIEQAIGKCNREWASLPGSPYGQPTISIAKCLDVYRTAGGSMAGEADTYPPTTTPAATPATAAAISNIGRVASMFLPGAFGAVASVVPELITLFGGGSEVATRNAKAAQIVVDTAKAAVGATNEQQLMEKIQNDPSVVPILKEAVKSVWYEITPDTSGVKAAREASFATGAPPFWMQPVFWVTILTLPLVYLSLYAVLFTPGYSAEIKAMVIGAIFSGLLTGAITSFYFGTSASSQRKTELAANPNPSV